MEYQKQKSGRKIPFAIATRKIKCLGINLTKEVKYLYSENYTTLKKTKEDTNKRKHIPCSWTGSCLLYTSDAADDWLVV